MKLLIGASSLRPCSICTISRDDIQQGDVFLNHPQRKIENILANIHELQLSNTSSNQKRKWKTSIGHDDKPPLFANHTALALIPQSTFCHLDVLHIWKLHVLKDLILTVVSGLTTDGINAFKERLTMYGMIE